jgi:hypothetical protein
MPSFVVTRLVQTMSWNVVLESARDHDARSCWCALSLMRKSYNQI